MAGRLSKEDITDKFPKYYKPLSRRLYEVLECIGASTEIRDLMGKYITSTEILGTVCMQFAAETNNTRTSSSNSRVTDPGSVYICGSSFEGTTTLGMQSDLDSLIVEGSLPVVTDISDAQIHDCCLLMVQDFYTPPGYVKLQWVRHGVAEFLSSVYIVPGCDREYRSVSFDDRDIEDGEVIHGPARSIPPTEARRGLDYDGECRAVVIDNSGIKDGEVINGPARSIQKTETSRAMDFVLAFRCRKIPDCASEWFTRQRHYNWPTPEWIDKCRSLGCFFVYVGHPDSEEKHLQWRMSFSLQERFLVTQFNSVQLKCYILMKIIKNDIIHKDVGEKSLTSYHCKTCLLYLIENTPVEFWREDNLLVCLYTYLSQILRCVEAMDCPNYFLPDENMFNGRLHGEIQIKVRKVLRNILSSNFHFLLNLNTDDLGRRFRVSLLCGVPHSSFLSDVYLRKNGLLAIHASKLIGIKNDMLHKFQSSHSTPAVSGERLHWLKLRLQNTDTVTEHTQEQTQNALSPVCQYIDISLMSVLAVLSKSLNKSNAFKFRILTSEKWHQISLKSDQFSSKLKQASLLYMMEFPDVSLDVLLILERRLRNQLSLWCSDDRNTAICVEELLSLECNTAEEMLEKCCIPRVVYLPAEKDLTPTALCYEMNRSLGFSEVNREDWYDWAIVDGKILLYFLLYLNHHHFGMETNAAADVENIKWLIETDSLLGHRETALNLLGWIYKESGRVDRAVECFRKSLTIQPAHNAAFWHLRDIENVLHVFVSSRFTIT